jgi:radical SAM superfamily enzyme YgiQ (UPF0313 family)
VTRNETDSPRGADRGCDLLLSHGYRVALDEHEREIMMPYPPLGLLYLSSHLKAGGFSVAVHDATFAESGEFRAALDERRPAVVGLYATLMTRARVLEMIAECRRRGIWVVVGGPEPAPNAASYLAHGAHAVVVGEGERTMAALLGHLPERGLDGLDAIDGLCFLGADGRVVATPPRAQIRDLSAQPRPDREAVDLDRYLATWREHHGYSSVSLVTSRGCPYTCRWCSHDVYGRSHRRRSVEDVADEVAWIVDRYHPDQLWFTDDVFTLNRPWVAALAAELERRDLRVPFECISRADRIDEPVADALAEMGCRRLWIGAESGSQRILDRMGRLTRVEDVRSKTAMLRARGIEVGMFIMLGYEGETVDDLRATVDHLTSSAPDVFLTTVAYPIQGTDYARDVASKTVADRPWAERTDRDLRISGRHSRRWYRHATRWMVNEVNAHRARREGRTLAGLRLGLKARLGRLGMALTRRQREEDEVAASGRGWGPHEEDARLAARATGDRA